MKFTNVHNNFAGLITMTMMVVTIISCSEPKQLQSPTYEHINSPGEVASTTSFAPLRYDRKPDLEKVDMKVWYESGLKNYGISDFSTESLILLMDNNIGIVRFYSASLLGLRKESSAIPRLEKALSDKSLVVQRAATKALLQMDNRKGIKVIEEFCAKASKEMEQGDFRNTADMSNAARVLAEAGEVSSIPYLRQLLHYEQSWGVRITAVRSLKMLYEKEPAVLTDISSMANDEEPQVRREASEIVKKIQSKK